MNSNNKSLPLVASAVAATVFFGVIVYSFVNTQRQASKNDGSVGDVSSLPNRPNNVASNIVIREIHPSYATNFSDDKVLVGGSHNIFIGQVINKTGNEERGIGPETQFEVSVLYNVKGSLQGTITVDQQGGYKNGVYYVIDGDVLSPGVGEADQYFLQPGFTYLFATRSGGAKNWHTLISFPAASKLITSNRDLTIAQLKSLAENDSRVKQLEAAYPDEILFPADVAHNYTLNSYASLHPTLPPPPPAPSSTAEINPPIISDLTNVVASTSVAISWTTNKPATSQLLFGSSTAMSAYVPDDPTPTTSHSIRVSYLSPGTTYYFEAQSTDASGKIGSSAQQSFTTPNAEASMSTNL